MTTPAPLTVPDEAVRLAEALIFASTEPVSARRLADLLEGRQIMPRGRKTWGLLWRLFWPNCAAVMRAGACSP